MKLGIVGSGMIVKDFLSFVEEIKSIELVAIIGREKSLENLEKLKEENGIKKIYTDYSEALKDGDIDTIYVGLPNNLHYEYSKKALSAGKNVICEKPFTHNLESAKEIIDLAKDKSLFLFEAITNQYLPNYKIVRDNLESLGNIRAIQCNFSQYSSRYDDFLNGKIAPVFNRENAGGALMDLNVYNIYFIVGLFGRPLDVFYYPNINRDIDTSGLIVLTYDGFVASCFGAKDSKSESFAMIQGEKGYMKVEGPSSMCTKLYIDNQSKSYLDQGKHRMYYEFVEMEKIMGIKDYASCYKLLDNAEIVMEILDKCNNGI